MCLVLMDWLSHVPRSVWVCPRSTQWWIDVEGGRYGDEWWKSNFRMNRDTFNLLCSEVRPYVERECTVLREPISVEKRVAVTIWKLATNVEYRTLSNLFGLGRSTVCTVFIETCKVIADKLFAKYVKVPSGDMLKEVVNGFEELWGFPQAAGAIDGTHIPIIRPEESASDYYNRKGFYSIIMQALVDHRGRFMDVYIGWPGKVHDARVLANSTLYTKASSGKLFPPATRRLCGVDVPLVILGDPAYPLLPWLMKPYVEHNHTPADQKLFNYRESRARMVVENSFGRLKGRWRCLLKRLDVKLESVATIVATCTVLHNMCEMYGDNCQVEWTCDDPSSAVSSSAQPNTSTYSCAGSVIRNAIKDYLS